MEQTGRGCRRDSTEVKHLDWSDEELLAAVADRDIAALQELHRRHEPWLRARLRRRCADADVVAEVIQDTFHAVWRGADRYAGSGEVAAWIWGIGIRQLIGRLRKRPVPVPFTDEALTLARRHTPGDAELVSAEDAVLVGIEHGARCTAPSCPCHRSYAPSSRPLCSTD